MKRKRLDKLDFISSPKEIWIFELKLGHYRNSEYYSLRGSLELPEGYEDAIKILYESNGSSFGSGKYEFLPIYFFDSISPARLPQELLGIDVKVFVPDIAYNTCASLISGEESYLPRLEVSMTPVAPFCVDTKFLYSLKHIGIPLSLDESSQELIKQENIPNKIIYNLIKGRATAPDGITAVVDKMWADFSYISKYTQLSNLSQSYFYGPRSTRVNPKTTPSYFGQVVEALQDRLAQKKSAKDL